MSKLNRDLNQKFAQYYAEAAQGFTLAANNGIEWVYAQPILEAGALHGFSRRKGGVSQPPLGTLNLGWNRPEPAENILENYKRLAQAAEFKFEQMARVNYEHGSQIIRAYSSDCGKGMGDGEFDYCDALITNDEQIVLTTLHADCMAVFLFDPVRKASAMIHAGWKGTLNRIAKKAVDQMVAMFDCDPVDILAAVGPSISQKRFEVDEPVEALFLQEYPDFDAAQYCCKNRKTNKSHIDLWKIMAYQLFEAGTMPAHLTIAKECTYDLPRNYYSYRRDGLEAGAMAGFIKIL